MVTIVGRLNVDGHGHDVLCYVVETPTSANPVTTYVWSGACDFGLL